MERSRRAARRLGAGQPDRTLTGRNPRLLQRARDSRVEASSDVTAQRGKGVRRVTVKSSATRNPPRLAVGGTEVSNRRLSPERSAAAAADASARPADEERCCQQAPACRRKAPPHLLLREAEKSGGGDPGKAAARWQATRFEQPRLGRQQDGYRDTISLRRETVPETPSPQPGYQTVRTSGSRRA